MMMHSNLPDGWPPCAAIYLARTRRFGRYLALAALILAVISIILFLVGVALMNHPNRLGDFFQAMAVGFGGLFILLGICWVASWFSFRKDNKNLQTLFEGDFLVHWTLKKSDYAKDYSFKTDMPERLDAYIGRDTAYFAAGSVQWHPHPFYLVSAEVLDIPSGKFILIKTMMRYVITWSPPTYYTSLIPVPIGQEEKAKEVVEVLRS